MLKALCLTTALSIAWIPGLSGIAASETLPGNLSSSVEPSTVIASGSAQAPSSQTTSVPNSDSDMLCYMHTTDGRILDLQELCKKSVRQRQQAAQQQAAQQSVQNNPESTATICDPQCRPL
jgi:hypothetical protein